MAIDSTNIGNWLERNYTPEKLGNEAFKDAPLTAWLKHKEDAGGDLVQMRWEYGLVQGQGRTVAQANTRAAATTLKTAAVTLDYHPWYSVAEVDNLAIERAAGGNLSAAEILQKAIKRTMEGHGDWLETVMWQDGYPSLGQISNISGSTFTVLEQDIENWEQDQEIVLAASRTTGALRNSGASLVVTKVDRSPSQLKITCHAGIVATIGAAANGDYAFIKTSREDAASPTYQTALGIAAFVPPTDISGSDAFGNNSFNRSVDPQRLAGMRMTIAAGSSTTQGMIDFFVRCRKYGIKGDALWCSYERWGRMISEQGTQVRYVNVRNEKYGINIEGIKLFTPSGEISVFPSAKCPDANAWNLKRSGWNIESVNGRLIRPALRYHKALDSATDDKVNLRWRSFHQLALNDPRDQAVCTFAA